MTFYLYWCVQVGNLTYEQHATKNQQVIASIQVYCRFN